MHRSLLMDATVNIPVLLLVLPFVLLPIRIAHIHCPDSTVCCPLWWLVLLWIWVYLVFRTTEQVLSRGYAESDTAPPFQFGRDDR